MNDSLETTMATNATVKLSTRLSAVLALVVMYVSLYPLAALFSHTHNLGLNDISAQVLLAAFGEVCAIAYLVWIGRKHGSTLKNSLGWRWPGWKSILIGAAVGLGMFCVLQLVSVILQSSGIIHGGGNSNTSSSLNNLTGWQKVVFSFIFTPFVAPLLEETLFRGGIFTTLAGWKIQTKTKNFWLPLFGSAFLFALLHVQGFHSSMDVFVPIWIFAMGCAMGTLRSWYNSSLVSMAMHMTYNGLTILTLILATT